MPSRFPIFHLHAYVKIPDGIPNRSDLEIVLHVRYATNLLLYTSIPCLSLFLRILALSRRKYLLLLQHLRQLATLMHRDQNITSPNELLVDIQLRYRGPFRVLLDA
jgi:hypothetical protein